MRPALRVLRAVAALGGAAVLVVPAFDTPARADDETVQVGAPENRFAPSRVTISVGDTVTWQYAGGSGHTVTSTTANWDKNDPVGPPAILNFTTSYLFDAPGTYRYVCSTHEGAGMRGTVVVEGRRPRPTRTPTRTSSPRPTRTPAPSATATPSASPSATPSPSAGSATPGIVSSSPEPTDPSDPPPQPTVAPSPEGPIDLGSGGLTPHPATGRGKGLPVMLALLLIGGVGSAELRALLANAPGQR